MRISKICNIACSLILFAILFSWCGNANAGDIKKYTTVLNTDFKIAGFGGIRDIGTGTINITGVSGQVNRAILYWHGPTNSSNPAANAVVSFNGSLIHGTNIGISSDNCWGYANSQAYRADVTSLVTGNGDYALDGFYKNVTENININGVSLVVLYDDGDSTNNYDVAIYDGNDSNMPNSFDSLGWNITLNDIIYKTGSVYMDLNIGDGQNFDDGALIINGTTILPYGPVFNGNTVPNGASAATTNGGLWDIKSFDVTNFFSPGNNNLQFTIGSDSNDCLSMVVATVRMPAGSAPIAPPTNLNVSSQSASINTLAWFDNSNNEAGFYVERKTGNSAWVGIATLPANSVRYEDATVNATDIFTYRVQAFKGNDVSGYTNEAAVVKKFIVTGTANGQIELSWPNVASAVTYDVIWYPVELTLTSAHKIVNTNTVILNFNDNISLGKTYIVDIKARDVNGNNIGLGKWKGEAKFASSVNKIVVLVRGVLDPREDISKASDVTGYFGAPKIQPTYTDYVNGNAHDAVLTGQSKDATGLWRFLFDQGIMVFAADNIDGHSTDNFNNARNLWYYVHDTAQIPVGTQLNLIGHSMGGLISRAFINGSYSDYPVDNLITLNSPHMGSTVANLARKINQPSVTALAPALLLAAGNPWLAGITAGTLVELKERTGYLSKLSTLDMAEFNEKVKANDKVNYWTTAGVDTDTTFTEERPDDMIVWTRSALYIPRKGHDSIDYKMLNNYRHQKDLWLDTFVPIPFTSSNDSDLHWLEPITRGTVKKQIETFGDQWNKSNAISNSSDRRFILVGNEIGNHGSVLNVNNSLVANMFNDFVLPIIQTGSPKRAHGVGFSNNLWKTKDGKGDYLIKYDPDTPFGPLTSLNNLGISTNNEGINIELGTRDFWTGPSNVKQVQALADAPPTLPSLIFVKLDKDFVVKGNSIQIAAFYGLEGTPISNGQVVAAISKPDGTVETISLVNDGITAGVYRGVFTPQIEGDYDVSVTGTIGTPESEKNTTIAFKAHGKNVSIGEITEAIFDPDQDSRIDGLIVSIPVQALIAGTYRVLIDITDQNNVSATNFSADIMVDSTLTNTVSVLISSDDVLKNNLSWPFKVSKVKVWDSNNNVQFEQYGLYSTQTSLDSIQTDVPGYIKVNNFDISETNGIVSITSSATSASGSPLTYTWDFGDGTVLTGVTPTHSYARSGEFTLTLKISDSDGNITTVTRYLNVVVPNTSLSIAKGWNLISLPLTPANAASQIVLGSALTNINSVWSYQNAAWKIFLPNNTNFSDLTEITSGNAYWIESLVDTALPYNGVSASKTMDLALGWNFVGYNSASTQTVITAVANIGANLESVWGYTNGTWHMYDPTNPGFSDLANMEPGKGYWVKTKLASTWTLP